MNLAEQFKTSRLGGVRFHTLKKFRTHMQTPTLECFKGLSTVKATGSVKRKKKDLLSFKNSKIS